MPHSSEGQAKWLPKENVCVAHLEHSFQHSLL